VPGDEETPKPTTSAEDKHQGRGKPGDEGNAGSVVNEGGTGEAVEEERDAEAGVGLFASLGIVMVVLFLVKYALLNVESSMARQAIYFGTIFIFLYFQFFRDLFIQAMILVLILASGKEYYEHRDQLKRHEMSKWTFVTEVLVTATSMGPIASINEVRSIRRYAPYLVKVDTGRDEEINTFAAELSKDCADNDRHCEAKKIAEYVANEIRYQYDPKPVFGDSDYIKNPKQTLESKAGDCEDQTILSLSLTNALGLQSYMVFTSGHTYPMVCFDDTYNAQVPYMKLKGQYCYHTEPTDSGSSIGSFTHPTEDIVYIADSVHFEPVTKTRLQYPKEASARSLLQRLLSR
jgi:hypothetical protein